ncbi:MAG: hypothetical protein ISQ92_00425 [Pelagibacteraceae bacterium]|jgi:hypothetical protein|nr:hypothetical protein [Pelagibacteraceae bacterium]
MKKKLIIFLSEIKIRKYDILRFDLDELESKYGYKIEIHELIEYIHPGFSSMFTNIYKNRKIRSFKSFSSWKARILFLKKNFNSDILIISIIPLINFRSLKINYFINKNNFTTLKYRNITFPVFKTSKSIFSFMFEPKLISLVKIKHLIQKYFLTLVTKYLSLSFNYTVVFGRKDKSHIRKNKSTKIISGNSFDYNMYLKHKNIKYKKRQNYALFLESPAPIHNQGDRYLTGDRNFFGTKKNWLKSINNFFDFIEKELKIKVLIAPHPKIKHLKRFSKIYDGREVVEEGLYQTSKNAKLIISRDSTGFAYAAIYKISAIFVYNNDLLQNKKFLNDQESFASCLGLKPVNVDNKYSKKNLEKFLKFDKEIYNNYVQNYLTTRKDGKKNFEIIHENI